MANPDGTRKKYIICRIVKNADGATTRTLCQVPGDSGVESQVERPERFTFDVSQDEKTWTNVPVATGNCQDGDQVFKMEDLVKTFGMKFLRCTEASVVHSVATATVDPLTTSGSALDLLMKAKEPQLPPLKTSSSGVTSGVSNKDRLYNDLLKLFRAEGWLFRDVKDGSYVIQCITNTLWAISDSYKTLNEAYEHDRRLKPVPKVFGAYAGYNDLRAKRRKRVPLDSSSLASHAGCLLELLTRPCLQRDCLTNLRNAIRALSECLHLYSNFLKTKLDKVAANHALPHPVRQIDEHISVEIRDGSDGYIGDQYSKLNEQIIAAAMFHPILFDERTHLLTSFKDKHDRFRFVEKMRLSEKVILVRYQPGGPVRGLLYIMKVPKNASSEQINTQLASAIAKLRPDLPQFHTRAMQIDFKNRVENIASISPAALEYIYAELTGDQAACQNPVMRQRLQMAALGEPNIVTDLRHLNPGRPSNKFDVFWEHLGSLLEEMTAVDDRRAEGTHMSEIISIRDLIERTKSRCPDGTLIPSPSTVRLQFTPRNKYAERAQAFTCRFEIQFKIQIRQLRASHPDAHFCAAQFKYLRERACELKNIFFVCVDDKAKVPVGEPGQPVSTGVRVRPAPTPMNTTLDSMDHDVSSKGKLTPSVFLVPDIPTKSTESWYQGGTTVVLHDAVLECASSYQSAACVVREWIDAGTKFPILYKFSDGGTEHRNILTKVQLSLIGVFKLLNLDMLVAARCAPGQSWSNPVERVMATLNLALQNVSTSRVRCTEEVEEKLKPLSSMSSIREKAAEDEELAQAWKGSVEPVKQILASRFTRLQLKGTPFKVKPPVTETDILSKLNDLFPLIDPKTVTKSVAQRDPELKEFLATHCRERQYMFQIRKCGDPACCIPPITPTSAREWIPDPVLGSDGHYRPLSEVLGTETTDAARPGANPVKKGSVCDPFVEEAVAEEKKEALFVARNARGAITCAECGKPRVLYSKHPVSAAAKRRIMEMCQDEYTCGAIVELPHISATCRLNMTCGDKVELPYYTAKIGERQDICCYCADSGAINVALKAQYKTVLPICRRCEQSGKEAYVAREFGNKKKK